MMYVSSFLSVCQGGVLAVFEILKRIYGQYNEGEIKGQVKKGALHGDEFRSQDPTQSSNCTVAHQLCMSMACKNYDKSY